MMLDSMDDKLLESFERYYKIQMGGQYNMLMDSAAVMKVTGIPSADYWYIINHYDELMKAYKRSARQAEEIERYLDKCYKRVG